MLGACDASVSNAALPSVGNGNSVPASFAAISSSSESSASENASSADADESELSSGETQKSSSSNPAAISSSSKNWWDYDTRGCCPDTLYIENGDSIFHFIPGASCPPPSVITVSCVPPAVVNKDSLKALSISSSVMANPRAKCIVETDIVKNCQIEIPFAQDLCEVDADISFKRSGDTLSVEYANVRSETTCTCRYNHKFDIPAEYKDVKYFILDSAVYEYSPDDIDIIWP